MSIAAAGSLAETDEILGTEMGNSPTEAMERIGRFLINRLLGRASPYRIEQSKRNARNSLKASLTTLAPVRAFPFRAA